MRTDAEEEDVVTGLFLHSFFRILNFAGTSRPPPSYDNFLFTQLNLQMHERAALHPLPRNVFAGNKKASEALKYSFSHA